MQSCVWCSGRGEVIRWLLSARLACAADSENSEIIERKQKPSGVSVCVCRGERAAPIGLISMCATGELKPLEK